jgi:glycosyltransferase involved in cell wall biosynthesis
MVGLTPMDTTMTRAGLPLVSIVTPVLNGARFLPDLLASIRGQDYGAIEHVVVDGGSTDGTVEILRAAPGVVWTTAFDRGMYDAINEGFRRARGEILAYQNADDRYVVPGAVSAAVSHLVRHPEVDAAYGRFRYINEDGQPRPGPIPRHRPFDARRLRRYNFIPPHSLFVRASAIKDDGHWFDPSLQFAGDWDWVLGLAQAGKAFAALDEVLSEFRIHRRSKTATFGWPAKVREWRRICRRRGASLPLLLWHEAFYIPARRRLGLPA